MEQSACPAARRHAILTFHRSTATLLKLKSRDTSELDATGCHSRTVPFSEAIAIFSGSPRHHCTSIGGESRLSVYSVDSVSTSHTETVLSVEAQTKRFGLSGLQSIHVIGSAYPAMMCRSCCVWRSAT